MSCSAQEADAELARASRLLADGALVEAHTVLHELLPRVELGDPTAHIKVLQLSATVATHRLRYNEAYEMHRRILTLQGRQGATVYRLLASFTEMATALYLGARYRESLAITEQANKSLGEALSGEALALLARLQAHVHECSGAYALATRKLGDGRALAPSAAEAADELVRERLLVVRWRKALELQIATTHGLDAWAHVVGHDVPAALGGAEATQLLNEAERVITGRLLSLNRWANVPLQTPHTYVRGLRAAPWPKRGMFPTVGAVAAALGEAHAGLLQEFAALDAARLLTRDADCIHAVVGGAAGQVANGAGASDVADGAAAWRRYEVTGVWHERRDRHNCSLATPSACALLRRLRALPDAPRVLRAGYSSLAPSSWIRPHFGASNTVLKLHLGLRVPSAPAAKGGAPCVWMRVGSSKPRTWTEGRALLFDDSFEHEVENRCASERVVFLVFQMVLRHPDLPDQEGLLSPLVSLH